MMPTAVTSPLLFGGRTNVASPPRSHPSNEDLDTNMVIILGALLLVLVTVLGLNSIRRCSRRATVDIYHEAMAHPPPPAGLRKTDLSQIPVRVYKPGPGAAISETDCPICLGEFMDGEQVRVLPKCNHVYHVSCIDTWLMAHSSCPTCRHSLIDLPLPGSASMQAGFRSPENESGRPGAVVVVINC